MQAERWQRIEQLYEAARAVPLEKRGEFLEQACSDDAKLCEEVQSLLDQQTDGFLESAPVPAVKTLAVGAKLGNFEIIELIGRGGMGEVYRARDARLGRDVAIKVLPEHLSKDPQALARFTRETKALAALSHPNILTIYDTGSENDTSYAATELLEGETLRSLLARGALTWRKAVDIGTPLAEGLAAAHSKGIIHRDLKPANIFLTSDGRVKILDFGWAHQEQPRFKRKSQIFFRRDSLFKGYPHPCRDARRTHSALEKIVGISR